MIEILESQKKLFRKNPYKIVFRLQTDELKNKKLLQYLLKDAQTKGEITNLRGRPNEAFEKNSKNIPYNSEELLSIFGESDQKQEFCYSLNTAFSSYTDEGKIIHNLKNKADGILSRYEAIMNVAKVCSWMPLRITGFRLGMESYSKFFLGSMVGAVPTINSRFYLETEKNKIWVLVDNYDSAFSHHLLIKLDKFMEENNIFNSLINTLRKQYE